jgi:hypothetical protein
VLNCNIGPFIDQGCGLIVGPWLNAAVTPDALNALAACPFNPDAFTCDLATGAVGGLDQPVEDVEATDGPVTPAAMQMGGAPRASGAQGVIVSALLAAPVMLALWMVYNAYPYVGAKCVGCKRLAHTTTL